MYIFFKYHVLGNSYLTINFQKYNIKTHKSVIQLICHKNYGLCSDGILNGPIIVHNMHICYRIFNYDGSEAEISGNGIRIAALDFFNSQCVDCKKVFIHVNFL